MLPEIVLQKLESLPAEPGCYLFKDGKGRVVYVGKAKSLRSRVRSYFQEGSSDERYFVPLLARTVGDLETIVTASEKEAAILEDSLVKEHQPRFNVKLRDDKSFLCLRIDARAPWPRIDVVRRPTPDGARYFGPYPSATSARRTVHLVNKHFQLRTCTDVDMAARKRPCLQFQIRRCLAPCVYPVDGAWYADQVRAVGLFLDGRHDELSRELDQRMRAAAADLAFELAATYRDQLRAIDAIRQEQRVVAVSDADRDVVGLYREGDLAELQVLFVRGGRLRDTASFPVKGVEMPDAEILAAFLAQFYGAGGAATIPDELVVPTLPDGAAGVAEWLSERRGRACTIVCPQRGAKADLLALANENAAHAFREHRRSRDDVDERLAQVQKRLRLPTLPRRIECCDISHLGGGDTVGAVVALLDGQPDKRRYRTFHVRGVAPGDDYAAMYQVLARRFRRGRVARDAAAGEGAASEAEAEGARERIEWDLPDLFVVDGGRGQLHVALSAARDLGLHDLPIVGLAKEHALPGVAGRPDLPAVGPVADAAQLVDRVYLPGQKNGIPLSPNSAPLYFLARARDEAHRFSNRARERLGKVRRLRSDLDDVAGVGPATRTALLRTLGTLEGVRAASDEALLAVPGVTRRTLAALRARFPPRAPVASVEPPAEPAGLPADGTCANQKDGSSVEPL